MMKKLLIIDDKVDVNPSTRSSVSVAQRWRDEKVAEFSTLVEVANTSTAYFQWDLAGNNCEAIFDTESYEYVFIHHSQKGETLFPSNIIDLIKLQLGEKLVLFSGSINEFFLNTENPDFKFRSISRPKLWERIREFIKKSFILNEWVIEVLYYDYEKRLIGQTMQMQDDEMSSKEIFQSRVMDHFLRLKHIRQDVSLIEKLTKLEGYDLINELRKL